MFTAQGTGAFTFSLTWAALNAAAFIDSVGGHVARSVDATFVDSKGHSAKKSISVSLTCPMGDGGLPSLCSGASGLASPVSGVPMRRRSAAATDEPAFTSLGVHR